MSFFANKVLYKYSYIHYVHYYKHFTVQKHISVTFSLS